MSPPSESSAPSTGEPKSYALAILSMSLSNGDTICDDNIDVEYQKETTSAATLSLSCTSTQMPIIDPPVNIPAMIPNGTQTFHMSHNMGSTESNVQVTATLTQGGNTPSLTKTVNVDCNMMMAAKAAGMLLPVSLDPAIERPIRLVRGQDKILLGTYLPAIGDHVVVRVQHASLKEEQVLDEATADSGQALESVVCPWSRRLPCALWAAGGDHRPFQIRLLLMKGTKIVYAKTYSAVVICG